MAKRRTAASRVGRNARPARSNNVPTAKRSKLSGKGKAQTANLTRAAIEDPAHVGRGNTDFNRMANKTIEGHRSAADRKAQRRRDVRNTRQTTIPRECNARRRAAAVKVQSSKRQSPK
jgi:hypothetical protein